MGKRKRDANGKIIYDRPSDLDVDHKARKRPGRRNGSENSKRAQDRAGDALALEEMPELGLRKTAQCTRCNATKY